MTEPRERAVALGPERSLVAVVTTPVPAPPPERPVIVVLNAGVIHRVGANRVNVGVSRALAREGFVTCRFDFSGIGDSEPRQGLLDLNESVRLDIADVLGHLAGTQRARSFALVGLCSGANHAFRYAVMDPRVRAAVLIDPAAFPTFGHQLRYYGKRAVRLRSWWNVLRGRNLVVRAGVRRIRQGFKPDPDPMADGASIAPTRNEMRDGLRALIAREVELLVVYTGGVEVIYNYRRQFHDLFPEEARSPRVRVEFRPESDHTFSAERHKRWLMDLVTGWFGGIAGRLSVGSGQPGQTTGGYEARRHMTTAHVPKSADSVLGEVE
jgi:pimeloyl-ACP methyl ester carboxylesterase